MTPGNVHDSGSGMFIDTCSIAFELEHAPKNNTDKINLGFMFI